MCECFWYWVSTLVQSLFGCLLKDGGETKTRREQQRTGPRDVKIAGLNSLGDYRNDNIDVGHIMKGLCKQPSSPAAVIINSGNKQSKGEHWEAIYISPTDQTPHKSRVEFFDSYGLPPIQDGTSKLLDLLSQKDWVCNHQPVQDIMDMTSRACGQHCLYYIMNR